MLVTGGIGPVLLLPSRGLGPFGGEIPLIFLPPTRFTVPWRRDVTKLAQDFTMWSGDTRRLSITVDDGASPPVAINLTSSTIEWHLAKRLTSTVAILTKTVGGGIALTDPVNGVFEVTIDPADTADLSGEYYHEAEVTLSGGDKSTVLVGIATIKRDLIL